MSVWEWCGEGGGGVRDEYMGMVCGGGGRGKGMSVWEWCGEGGGGIRG